MEYLRCKCGKVLCEVPRYFAQTARLVEARTEPAAEGESDVIVIRCRHCKRSVHLVTRGLVSVGFTG